MTLESKKPLQIKEDEMYDKNMEISLEQAEIIVGMVELCCNRGWALGMREGYNENGTPTKELLECKSFIEKANKFITYGKPNDK